MSNNLATVQQLYDCFGKGDIPGIMNMLSDNVVFEHNGNLPWSGRFEGKAGAGAFFQALGGNVTVTGFQPSNFRSEGNNVVNNCRFDATVLSTGNTLGYELLMTWTFDGDGKPVRYQGLANVKDLAMSEAAFKN